MDSEGSGNRGIALAGAVIGGFLLVALFAIAWSGWDWGRAVFSRLCHQHSDRCFVVSGTSLAVCARCIGIYAGITGGCLLAGVGRFSDRSQASLATWGLLIALGANGADFALERMGVYSNLLGLRCLLGFGLGLALAWFVFARIASRQNQA